MTRTVLLTFSLLAAPLAHAQTAPVQTPAAPAQTAPEAATFASAADAAAQARDLAARARQTYPSGSVNIDQPLWKQAAAAAEGAVKAEPRNAGYLRLRAEIYTEVGFWRQAQLGWEAYFQVNPGAGAEEKRAAASALYNLGYAAYTRNQPSQASILFRQCLTLDPQNALCAGWAARTALEAGQYAQAQELYAQALRGAPNDKSLAYFAGLAQKAGTYGPAATRAFSRAYADLDAGRKPQALAGFQEAARSAPNFAEAQREAGRLALELGDAGAAVTAYQGATGLPGASAADRYNLALAQEGQQFGLAAVQTFRAAYARYTAGDRAGAEAGFAQATTQNANYAKAWAWLGRVRYEAKNYAAAAEAYGNAARLDPNDKTSAYYLRLAQQGK
ncbi:tetratricopeptide repeat protein [Deinococcus sp. Leaf326]|uniref:tetratricopeptide repeat protein n=1 Tax=Deinococcus sp. Leaf326 TaxID=1736338 RepID=UPI0006FF6F23|nr:tetratricopeptide repeat protein [Deinococcus sp. Leaf326]KQR15591.1 hypothetical protein ASF71_08100 [Deinococcus sp. Leaf326]